MITVDAEDLTRSKWRGKVFAKLANGGYIQAFECIDHPKLVRTISCMKINGPKTITMSVNDQYAMDLQQAARMLTALYQQQEPTHDQALAESNLPALQAG